MVKKATKLSEHIATSGELESLPVSQRGYTGLSSGTGRDKYGPRNYTAAENLQKRREFKHIFYRYAFICLS